MSNIQPDGWDLDEVKFVELTPKELETYGLQQGDILFNRTNSKELVGKCEVFNLAGEWVFASYLMRLTVDRTRALPEFVAAYLNGPGGRAQIERDSRQIIGMTNINADEIRALRMPLPPDLDTQATLLAKLDAAKSHRDDGLSAAGAALDGLDAFILDELGLTLPPPHDPSKPFARRPSEILGGRIDPQFHLPQYSKLLSTIRSGASRPLGSLVQQSSEMTDPAKMDTATFRYVEIGAVEVRADRYEVGEVAVSDAPSRARMALRRDDIILSTTRPDRGAVARVRPEHDGAIASTGFAVLRGLTGVDRDYLFEVLQCSAITLQLRQRSSGGAYPAITADELDRVVVPWPEPSKRKRVAGEVDRRRAEARSLAAESRSKWAEALQAFDNALLRPAP